MPARLSLLGRPHLLDEGGTPIHLPDKAFGVVALIALSERGFATRAYLSELFWGSDENRHGSLRKLLWTVRSRTAKCGIQLFAQDDRIVALARHRPLLDLESYVALVSQGGSARLVDLCRLYKDDLLEGTKCRSPLFTDWLTVQRRRLRNAFVASVTTGLNARSGPYDRDHRKIAAERLLDVDPYNETAARALMQIHADDGEAALLHHVYAGLAGRLEKDFGTAPAAETSRLFRSLARLPSRLDEAPIGREEWPVVDRFTRHLPALCILPPIGPRKRGPQDLAQALMTDISMALYRTRRLRIIAPRPSWQLSPPDVDEAGFLQAFAIDYVMSSTWSSIDGMARLTITLYQAVGRVVLWVDQFVLGRHDTVGCCAMIFAALMTHLQGHGPVSDTETRIPDNGPQA